MIPAHELASPHGTLRAGRRRMIAKIAAGMALVATELVSIASVYGVAAEISADEEAAILAEATADSSSAGSPSNANAARPSWVDASPRQSGEVYRRVVSVGPYRDIDECYTALEKETENVVSKFLRRQDLDAPGEERSPRPMPNLRQLGVSQDYIAREMIADEYVETIHSPTVGEMKQLYVLMEIGDAERAFLQNALTTYYRNQRVWVVGLCGGGIVGALAVLLGLLQLDTWTRGYCTARIFSRAPKSKGAEIKGKTI